MSNKIYLAMDYDEIIGAFTKREDAEKVASDEGNVAEIELHEDLSEYRTWYTLSDWRMIRDEPVLTTSLRVDRGDLHAPRRNYSSGGSSYYHYSGSGLVVEGWDLEDVWKTYEEQANDEL